jgi:hypothetical protein
MNNSQPMRITHITPGMETKFMDKYKMAYIPANFFQSYCKNGFCWGNLLNYLA